MDDIDETVLSAAAINHRRTNTTIQDSKDARSCSSDETAHTYCTCPEHTDRGSSRYVEGT